MKRKHLDESGKIPAWLVGATYTRSGSVIILHTPASDFVDCYTYEDPATVAIAEAVIDAYQIPSTSEALVA